MRERESGSGDSPDLAGAGLDVLQEPPPLGEHCEAALAQAAHTLLEFVQGTGSPAAPTPVARSGSSASRRPSPVAATRSAGTRRCRSARTECTTTPSAATRG